MNTSHTAQWIVATLAIVIVGAGLYTFEAPSQQPTKKVGEGQIEIAGWNWKKDRSGKILAVYGSVRNLTDQDIPSVVLELRTEAAGKPISHHAIRIRNIPAGGEKAFREDVIRTGKEEMGFLTIKSVEKTADE